MKSIRLLCYRAKLGDGHFIDNGIDWHTFIWNPAVWNKRYLRCSHSEIWIPNKADFFEALNYGNLEKTYGTCYTSTMGQVRKTGAKYNGVCKRSAEEVLTHPDRWFYTEIKVNEIALEHALIWADLEVANNRGYDVGDITKYFLPVRHQNLEDHKFICSGFSWAFLCKVAIWWALVDPKGYTSSELCRLFAGRMITDLPSPVRLAIWCDKAGCVFTDLQTGQLLKGN